MSERSAPLMSVIMLAHNHEPFIAQAIQSVFRQSYAAWELIIVDDGSTDRTKDVAAECINLAKNHRVELIVQEHKGPTQLCSTYNQALARAQGELIAILEADDLWPSFKLAMQVPDFRDKDVVLSFGDYAWVDAQGKIIRTVRLSRRLPRSVLTNDPPGLAAWYMAGLAFRTFTFPCTVVLKRSALESIGGFKGLPGLVNLVDFPTFLELSLHGRFAYHDQVLGYWRRHLRSLTTTHHEAICVAARAYSLQFLRHHPECWKGSPDLVYRRWAAALASTAFMQARVKLILREWQEARRLLWRVAVGRQTPATLRGVAALGLLMSLVRCDVENIMLKVLGYSLRGVK